MNITAALDTIATFNCITSPESGVLAAVWLIDGENGFYSEAANNEIKIKSQAGPIGGIEGTLDILATENNNNTEIVCRIIFNVNSSIDSSTVILAIQGYGNSLICINCQDAYVHAICF